MILSAVGLSLLYEKTIGRMILPVDRRTAKILFVFEVDAYGKYITGLMSWLLMTNWIFSAQHVG